MTHLLIGHLRKEDPKQQAGSQYIGYEIISICII